MNTDLPERIYTQHILKDLKKKMVFLGGPRQIGKTTLAKKIISNDPSSTYLNWDNEIDKKVINANSWAKESKIVVFDEIHKRKGWQNLIKGAWDKWNKLQNYIVTGSARLNVFRKGGDSMLGRYHYYQIHPFTLPELGVSSVNLSKLLKFGGFPEPLLSADEVELKRWHTSRVSKVVNIDLRDLENVSDINKVEILVDTLSSRVGSLLSYKSFSEDLEISDKTVKRWIEILSRMYICYLITPYGPPQIKAIKKSSKLYLWDWSQIDDPATRFENFVGSHLIKLADYYLDTLGIKCEVRFIRDDQGHECDFVFIKERKPIFAVECKLNGKSVSTSILKLKSKISIPMWYQVHLGKENKIVDPNFQIIGFEDFCHVVSLI